MSEITSPHRQEIRIYYISIEIDVVTNGYSAVSLVEKIVVNKFFTPLTSCNTQGVGKLEG
jgi:hypothetical protein